jgi:hypothetical protein
MGRDVSTYRFRAPEAGTAVAVTVTLQFRRAFQSVMDAKNWDTADILMAQQTIAVEPVHRHEFYLPLIRR